MAPALLSARGLAKTFGGVVAVADATFDVPAGEIRAIIGPNGAGKTTIFNLITGIFPLDRGEIRFKEQGLNGLST